MNEQAKVFLNKMSEKIRAGEFDEEFPFFTRDLIYASIKARIDKKLETGATPLLTETEVKEAIKDAKETAVMTAKLFLEAGILETFGVPDKWRKEILKLI